jgi:ABC-type transporter MlaC component
MKKIIALLTLFFAFTMNVSAQDKGTATELAKKDIESLSKIVKITAQNEQTFVALFENKHRAYATPNLSEERKKVVAKSVDAKLRATLDADQMAKLDSNPEVLKKLTQN